MGAYEGVEREVGWMAVTRKKVVVVRETEQVPKAG